MHQVPIAYCSVWYRAHTVVEGGVCRRSALYNYAVADGKVSNKVDELARHTYTVDSRLVLANYVIRNGRMETTIYCVLLVQHGS